MVAITAGKEWLNYIFPYIKKPFVWVSIREPDILTDDLLYDEVTVPELCVETLVLRFHDMIAADYSREYIENLKGTLKNFEPFNDEIKQQLDAFLGRHNGITHCVVNCWAGVSRSPAIGAYIERKTGEPNWLVKFYADNTKLPCRYICNMLGLPIKETTEKSED